MVTLAAAPDQDDPIILAMKIIIPVFVFGMFVYYGYRRRKGIVAEPEIGSDETHLAEAFAKKDALFASEKDLKGRLILTDEFLRYIGFDSQKCLLSVARSQVVDIECTEKKLRIRFRDPKRRQCSKKFKLLSAMDDVQARTPLPEFAEIAQRWSKAEAEA